MKRYIIFCLFILSFTYIYAVTIRPGLTLEENNGTYYVHFVMHDYMVKTDTFEVTHSDPVPPNQFGHTVGEYYFSRIQPGGDDYYDYFSEAGRPELPFYSLYLLLPLDGEGCGAVDMQILNHESVILPYDYAPSQVSNYSFEDFAYDSGYYNTYNDTWFHDDFAIDTFQFRHMKGITFSFYPIHYEPSSKSVTVTTEATFEISYKGTPLTETYLSYLLGMDRSIYYFFDNFVESPAPYPLINDYYLILTADEKLRTTQSISDFVTHKESLGYNVILESLLSANLSTADDIRKYIQDLYDEQELKYVLLVGDVGVSNYLPFSAGTQEDVSDPPTDLFYSCLSQNDINAQWKDYSPSVFVGRWPVQDTIQLRRIVDKTIASDLYLGHALTNYGHCKIALFSGNDPYSSYMKRYFYNDCKYIDNKIIQPYSYYTGGIIDGRDTSIHFNTMKNYMELIDDPTWMFVYRGHGDYDEIGKPYNWTYYSIGSITTRTLDFQPFGFGFSCLLGDIYKKYNFARSWLVSLDGGVSFLGSTTISYSVCNRYFSRKMFNQLKGRPNMTIGEFVCNAKAKYYNPFKVIWRRRETKKYILYGDPSLHLFGLDLQYNQPYSVKQRTGSPENMDNITSVQVFSVTGQLLRTSQTCEIDLQGLPIGTYMVVYNSDTNPIIQKIIVK